MLQKGFTLIELMIVVAIIGILSMFALPAYQDYTKRTYVAEGLGLASAAKMAATEYYSSEAKWPKDNAAAGLPADTEISSGESVKSVALKDNTITITFGTKVTKETDANKVALQATENKGSVSWKCVKKTDGTAASGGSAATPATGTTLPAKWLPSNCRDEVTKA